MNDISDSQLRSIWQQSQGRIVSVQTNGGEQGDTIYFRLPSGLTPGTCLNKVRAGQAIALLTNQGNYYLLGEDTEQQVASSKVLEYRRTSPHKTTEDYLIPILFSTTQEPEYWCLRIKYKSFSSSFGGEAAGQTIYHGCELNNLILYQERQKAEGRRQKGFIPYPNA